ncbi:protei far-red impaired response 1 [Striga asiatica]|uniref:Protei far-red impaired response 1 n=1 Tax=Striga asiatica TaxID=4170 RepID=A0A5A7P713_STRAF|nr:protei far-red impaired response 1 [Striga asiatica]
MGGGLIDDKECMSKQLSKSKGQKTFLVCDPDPIRTKGCGKRLKSSKEKAISQSARSCSLCGQRGHDKRKCPSHSNHLEDDPYCPDMSKVTNPVAVTSNSVSLWVSVLDCLFSKCKCISRTRQKRPTCLFQNDQFNGSTCLFQNDQFNSLCLQVVPWIILTWTAPRRISPSNGGDDQQQVAGQPADHDQAQPPVNPPTPDPPRDLHYVSLMYFGSGNSW